MSEEIKEEKKKKDIREILVWALIIIFLIFTGIYLALGQDFAPESKVSIPESLVCNQSSKGDIICMQNLDITLDEKTKIYLQGFKEISISEELSNTKITYYGEWTESHINIYKQIKVLEIDLLNQEYQELLNPTLEDCQLNPKLPKCP